MNNLVITNTKGKADIDNFVQQTIMILETNKKIISLFDMQSRNIFNKTKSRLLKAINEEKLTQVACDIIVPSYNFGKYPLYNRIIPLLEFDKILVKNIKLVANLRAGYTAEIKILTDNTIKGFGEISNIDKALAMTNNVEVNSPSELKTALNKFEFPIDCKNINNVIDNMIQNLKKIVSMDYSEQRDTVANITVVNKDMDVFNAFTKICMYYRKLVDLFFNLFSAKISVIDLNKSKVIPKIINESADIHMGSSLLLLEGNLEQSILERKKECITCEEILNKVVSTLNSIKAIDLPEDIFGTPNEKNKIINNIFRDIEKFRETITQSKQSVIVPIVNRPPNRLGVYKGELEMFFDETIGYNFDNILNKQYIGNNPDIQNERFHEEELDRIIENTNNLIDVINGV